jgi:lipopolysaccharide export system protein LptA
MSNNSEDTRSILVSFLRRSSLLFFLVLAIGLTISTKASPLITVESDLQQADNTTGVVTATGNVRVVYPEKKLVATAKQAQYFTKEGRIVLSGDVDVIQEGGNRLKADRVIYLVVSDRLIADPPAGEQVKSWIRITRQAQ